jgi:hypothetical protein
MMRIFSLVGLLVLSFPFVSFADETAYNECVNACHDEFTGTGSAQLICAQLCSHLIDPPPPRGLESALKAINYTGCNEKCLELCMDAVGDTAICTKKCTNLCNRLTAVKSESIPSYVESSPSLAQVPVNLHCGCCVPNPKPQQCSTPSQCCKPRRGCFLGRLRR